MFDSFIFSLNIIAPIFIVVLLGAVLKKYDFVNDNFLKICDKLVFKICLPCLLFLDIASADNSNGIDAGLILFSVAAVVVSFILPCIFVPLFIKDNDKRGAFIQGMFRSNAAILGMTLAANMFGDDGTSTVSMLLPFVITLFNIFAVIILSLNAPSDVKLTRAQLIKRIIKTIVSNPLIIAITLALLWKLTGIKIPFIVDRSLSYLSNMTMPLALISLGANFKMESLRGRAGLAIISASFKTIVIPAIAVLAAVIIGYRGVALGSIFIIFGGPTAVSSYIMAKEMKSDYQLASQILLISTLMSLVTLFLGIFILKATNLL